nr:antibiotic resistance protein VanZ [Roseibium litorale]
MRLKLPKLIQTYVDRHYLDVSLIRVLPLVCLLVFGALAGLVFNTGVQEPYDTVIHIGFYALLTLSIHSLFCCRLRISAVAAFFMGVAGEVLQAFTPNHEASMADAFANAIGISMVVAAIALIRSEKKQAQRQQPEEQLGYSLDTLGLEPVYLSERPSSGLASDK